MKRLALDMGEARIGIAASDETASLAFARGALARRSWKKDLAELARIAAAEAVQEIVVGLPLRRDGGEGDRALAARRFAARVGAATGLPVVLWDERMSTVEAEEALRAAGLDARAMRAQVDAEAARVILQRYLDHLRARRR